MSFRTRVILICIFMAAVVGVSYWYMKITTGLVEEEEVKTWRLRDHLLAVSFCNDSNGWAVGQYGTIIASTDGGKKWNYQNSGVGSDLVGVCAVSPDVAWAVGYGGVVVRTADGGKSWKKVSTGMRYLYNDVKFVSPQEGWIVGQYETILHSTDGGSNWEKVHGGEPAELDISQLKEGEVVKENFGAEEEIYTLNSVYFLNPQMGWAVGEYGTLIKTADGGKTWEKLKSGTGNTLLEVEFFDQNFGFAAGLDATILKTVDGGKTWTAESPNKKTHYYGVTFRRGGPDIIRKDAFAVGQGNIAYYAFLKKTYLQNWMSPTEMKLNIDYNWLYKVKFIAKTGEEAITVGEKGMVLRAATGGYSWELMEYPEKPFDMVLANN